MIQDLSLQLHSRRDLMRYKCLFNITPKSNTLNIRLEESYQLILEDLSVWKLKLPSKGNILGYAQGE